MFGARIMHGERLGPAVPPRAIDRYPAIVLADFRKCSVETLKRYCEKFEIEVGPYASLPEISATVAKHFQNELIIANEQATLKSFCEFMMSYTGGNTIDDVKTRGGRRLRSRRPRRGASAAANNGSDISDEDNPSDAEQQETLYCICNRPSFGEMVACDNPDCQGGEWFHLQCVGLREGHVPNNWFCPDCEKKTTNGDPASRRRRAKKARIMD